MVVVAVGTPLEMAFGRLLMISERSSIAGSSLSEISLKTFETNGWSLFATFLPVEGLQICSRTQRLFDRMMHGRNDLDRCFFPAELHNPPSLRS